MEGLYDYLTKGTQNSKVPFPKSISIPLGVWEVDCSGVTQGQETRARGYPIAVYFPWVPGHWGAF